MDFSKIVRIRCHSVAVAINQGVAKGILMPQNVYSDYSSGGHIGLFLVAITATGLPVPIFLARIRPHPRVFGVNELEKWSSEEWAELGFPGGLSDFRVWYNSLGGELLGPQSRVTRLEFLGTPKLIAYYHKCG